MAQTGYTPILIYSSSTASQSPAAGNLTNSTLGSELAINITDGKLFYKDNANAVQVIGWKVVPTTAGGTGLTTYTAGDTLYYASGTTFTKLAIGTSKTIMTSSGTAPQWSTNLDTTQGGTGLTTYTAGDFIYYASGTAFTKLAIGASGYYLSSTGSAPQWSAPGALTKVDDTNVTLTLGGSPSTALLNAASLTLGWTGQLAVSRGGTGLSSFTANGIVYASATNALANSSSFVWTGSTLGVGIAGPSGLAEFYANSNSPIEMYFRNVNSGASAYYILNLGNDTSPIAYRMLLVGSGATAFGGANSINLVNSLNSPMTFWTNNTQQFRIESTGQVASISTAGMGYGTGAGGTVTQATSRTTGVTINKPCGQITMFNAAGSTTAATFTVTNSTVAATDTIILNQSSGTNLYYLVVTSVAAGSFNITFLTSGGTATDSPVINFAVVKAVTF